MFLRSVTVSHLGKTHLFSRSWFCFICLFSSLYLGRNGIQFDDRVFSDELKSITNYPPLNISAAENWWLEDYCPFKIWSLFRGELLVSRGCSFGLQIRGKILSASTRRCRQHAMQVEAMRLEIEAMQDSQPFLGLVKAPKTNLDPKVIQAVTFLRVPLFGGHYIGLWKGHLTILKRSQKLARDQFFFLIKGGGSCKKKQIIKHSTTISISFRWCAP